MKIDIIVAAVPPRFDAIGQYTYFLAEKLALHASRVRLLTTPSPAASGGETGSPEDSASAALDKNGYAAISGVTVVPAFTLDAPSGIRAVLAAIEADPPDCVLLQYNPFQFGRWGLNLDLPIVMRAIKRKFPRMCVATMVHETYVPAMDLRFTIMGMWQRPQFRQLGQISDMLFFSIDPWAKTYGPRFSGTPTVHLPIPSNIQRVPTARAEARQRLGISDSTTVLGLFGALQIARMLPLVRDTLHAALQANRDVRLLHIGPDGPTIRENLKTELSDDNTVIFSEKPLPAEEVSRRFPAIDICLAPFADGVSTRRSSFMTGIQHGVATVGTLGHHTDDMLRTVAEKGPLLVDVHDPQRFQQTVLDLLRDPVRREAVAEHGEAFYNEYFTSDRVAQQLVASLQSCLGKKS